MAKYIFLIFFLLVLGVLIAFHDSVLYGVRLLQGQAAIILHARPVGEVLEDPYINDSIKTRIRQIEEIRTFAVRKLGLTATKNYTTYFEQDSADIMWVVTACPPFRLESYEWNFPVAGTFSYKGYFDRESAEDEAHRLKDEGYDVNIRTAEGWSTLGILKDPILSGMLWRDETGLADLIIHELTHATVFIKNNIFFNENLATFIGTQGTRLYLAAKYGEDSGICRRYSERMKDRERFNSYMMHSIHLLDSLYGTFHDSDPMAGKLDLKHQFISDIASRLDTVAFEGEYKGYRFFGEGLPDNTYFTSFLQYRGQQALLAAEFKEKANGELAEFIRITRKKYE